MRQVTNEKLKEILKKHSLFLSSGGMYGERADLRGAKLRGADLRGAILRGAKLRGADLRGAILRGAILRGADLSYAILSDAKLRGADLRGAILRGAILSDAKLRGADLRGAILRGADLRGAIFNNHIQEGLLEEIAKIVLLDPEKLHMARWHKCDTAHCLAGWACHLNLAAKALEIEYGTQIAGLLTLGTEAHSHFFDSDKDCIDWLKSIAGKQESSVESEL